MNPRTIRLLCVCLTLLVPSITRAAPTPKNPQYMAWEKKAIDAIGERWYGRMQRGVGGLASPGTVRITFRIIPEGRVTNLKVVSNTSNEAFANICLQSIIEAKFPPVPEIVLKQQGHNWVDFNIPFTLFAK